jgi:amino acid transporter
MAVSNGAGKVFGWFANMTSLSGLMSWFSICVTYLRFYKGLKAQGIDRRTLPFYSNLQPYAAWWATCACLVISVLNGWEVFLKGKWATDTFVTSYIVLVLFPLLFIGATIYYRESWKKPEAMDFKTGIAEINATIVVDPPPKNAMERFWQWLM